MSIERQYDLVQGRSDFLGGLDPLVSCVNTVVKKCHFAYWVDDISNAIDWAWSQQAKVIVLLVPATAFGWRHISFVMFRNGLMLEVIKKILPSSF